MVQYFTFTKISYLLVILAYCLSYNTNAFAGRPTINLQNSIKIVYGSNVWNTNPSKLNKINLLLRDSKTGRIFITELLETEPDSSIFESTVKIPWLDLKLVEPEIYIPNYSEMTKARNVKSFLAQFKIHVANQKVTRMPIIIKTFINKLQIIDIYNAVKDSKSALTNYQIQIENKRTQLQRNRKLNNALPTLRKTELVVKSEKIALLKSLKENAELIQAHRLKKVQTEKKLIEKWQLALNVKNKKTRNKLVAKANKIGGQALKIYKIKQYKKSEKLFRQAMMTSPFNTVFPFYYAISLYRNGKYNEASVVLLAAKISNSLSTEKHYYLGLIHYKLKELSNSSLHFFEARKSNHHIFSPAASFYIGLIFFNQEKYQKSKLFFNEVMVRSQDPRLHDKSEVYLELISRSMNYKKNRSRKYTINTTMALLYDTNVLTTADNEITQGTPGLADDREGVRGNISGDARYSFVYNEKMDASILVATDLIRTVNTDFRRADYWQSSIGVPFRWKSQWNSKTYSLSLSPQTSYLVMYDLNDKKERNILSGNSLLSELSIVMSSFWLANYTLAVSSEDSFLVDSVGIEDRDATKISLATRQNLFLNRARNQAIIPNMQILKNQAKGKNKVYDRILLGLTYAAPWQYSISWNASATVYFLNYAESEDGRKDTNITIGLEASRPISKHWSLAFNTIYTNNNSSESTNTYNRYRFMTLARFHWAD